MAVKGRHSQRHIVGFRPGVAEVIGIDAGEDAGDLPVKFHNFYFPVIEQIDAAGFGNSGECPVSLLFLFILAGLCANDKFGFTPGLTAVLAAAHHGMVVACPFYSTLRPKSDETAKLGVIHHMQMHIVTFVVFILGNVHHIVGACKGNVAIQDLLIMHN